MPDVADDGTTTRVEVWSGCEGGAEVRLMSVEGGGHAFPSGDAGRARIVGEPTSDFGSEVLWEFLSRFSLDG
jgi:polyhydroxybutyrate depolymerase